MPVTSTHPQYDAKIGIWNKCRAFLEGEEAVKAAKTVYLPMLSGMDDDDYDAYIKRAMFYGATYRTQQGLTGAILRKPHIIEANPKLEEILPTVGVSGESFDQIKKETIDEVEGLGRIGLLVDAGQEPNATPHVATYYAENITSWRTQKVNGKKTLIRVVLKECTKEPNKDDGFKFDEVVKYRVLRLGKPNADKQEAPTSDNPEQPLADGEEKQDDYDVVQSPNQRSSSIYYHEVWCKRLISDNNGKETEVWELEQTIIPKMWGGRTLDYIPFKPIGPTKQDIEPEKPPILDLVNVNASHYRSSADLEHGRHFTALPTPWATGFKIPAGGLRIGSGVAWATEELGARCGMLEFTGAGLAALQEALNEKQKLMAVLGARLLEEQKAGVEAEGTVRLRQSGEQSVLANISDSVSLGLTSVLQWLGNWMGLPDWESANIRLNKDFNVLGLDAGMLAALMAQVQAGLMSWPVYFHNVKRGELYPDGHTLEDEVALIAVGPPLGLGPEPISENDPIPEEEEVPEEEPVEEEE